MAVGECPMWLGVSESNRYMTKPATPRVPDYHRVQPEVPGNHEQGDTWQFGLAGAEPLPEDKQRARQNPADRIRDGVARYYEAARKALEARRTRRWQTQEQQLADHAKRKATLKEIEGNIWCTTDPRQLRPLVDQKRTADWDIRRLDMGILTQYGLILGDDLSEAKIPPAREQL